MEYLKLLVEHRLVGSISLQIQAFRNGLAVFLTPNICSTMRKCCTVTDVQLMMCGTPEIDIADWAKNTRYMVRCRTAFVSTSTL